MDVPEDSKEHRNHAHHKTRGTSHIVQEFQVDWFCNLTQDEWEVGGSATHQGDKQQYGRN